MVQKSGLSAAVDNGGFGLNSNFDFHFAKAKFLDYEEEYEKALESYDISIKDGFYYPEPCLNKARIYLMHRQYENAFQEFKDAIDLQDDEYSEAEEDGFTMVCKYLVKELIATENNRYFKKADLKKIGEAKIKIFEN